MKTIWYAVVDYLDDKWRGLRCNIKRAWWYVCWNAFGYKTDVCVLSGCDRCPHLVMNCCEQCPKWDTLADWDDYT